MVIVPVSSAFLEVKIGDIEKRLKKSQQAFEKGYDKRIHIDDTSSQDSFKIDREVFSPISGRRQE